MNYIVKVLLFIAFFNLKKITLAVFIVKFQRITEEDINIHLVTMKTAQIGNLYIIYASVAFYVPVAGPPQ